MRFLTPLICFLLVACQPTRRSVLYSSTTYTLGSKEVIQGSNHAVIHSSKHIVSNYQSPASTTFSRLIKYKFSINEKDNEMAPGNDHWVVIGEEHEAPVVTFGKIPPVAPPAPDNYLPVNHSYTFHVDMNPVLQAFKTKGFYEAYDGSRIAYSDFKGFYIAGAADPLSWDFVNLGNKGLKLEDPDGDGIYSISVIFNRYAPGTTQKEWKLQKDISQKPSYHSGQPVVDALYNLSLEEALKNIEPDSTFRTGAQWGGVWTRDISYSILLAFAYHQPDIAKISLLKKVKRKRIIQDTGSGGAWPVSSDRTTWALAAWELYKTTGDRTWLKEAYEIISNTLTDDALVLFDPMTGLYKGESSFLDWREQTYPRWMNNADIYRSLNLGTNVVHYQAHRIAAMMASELGLSGKVYEERAEQIRKAINQQLWMPDKGYYAQYLYGRNHLLSSPRFEALGEALAILFDVASPDQAKEILQKAPLTPYGVTCIFPQIPGIPPYHNNAIWPFVQSYWNLAAAKAGNEAALSHGLASLYRGAAFFLTNYENMVAETGDFKGTEVNSERMLWSMAGNIAMVHRVFMGMQFESNGLLFMPKVPSAYPGTKTLSNFRYREAMLTITVKGTGTGIRSFSIDGKKTDRPFVPDTIRGRHRIEIELDNQPFPDNLMHLANNQFSPEMPQVSRKGKSMEWTAIKDAKWYRVYLNGKSWKDTKETSIMLPSGNGEYQVVAIGSNGLESFASEPQLIVTDTSTVIAELERFGGKATYPFIDFSGEGFCEVTNNINREIMIPVELKEDGIYRIDFRYSNGSGPWNTDNKCAIRTLYREEQTVGTYVFPQRGTDEWSNWGYSNSYIIPLKKGKHIFRLKLEEWNTNMNVEVNRAMIDHLRMTRMNDK